MRLGDPADPLLRQVLPLLPKRLLCLDSRSILSMTRRPRGSRVAAKISGPRAAHCNGNLCRPLPLLFSSTLSLRPNARSLADWQPAIDEIAGDATLHEVILSGGDPLTLVDGTLVELIESLADIRHLRRLRIHTRLPIVIPERVTDELIDMLQGCRLTPIVVLQRQSYE